mmetsp:Transcript_6008/g.13282  ORF Transcript_6008/g.13282 Transcript_6008/m.13282 type:complete len:300 (-) Transcript_6008:887-1786(-)
MSETAAAVGLRGSHAVTLATSRRVLVRLTAWDAPSFTPAANWKTLGCAPVKYSSHGARRPGVTARATRRRQACPMRMGRTPGLGALLRAMRLPPQSVGTSRVSGGKWPEKKQKAMRSQKVLARSDSLSENRGPISSCARQPSWSAAPPLGDFRRALARARGVSALVASGCSGGRGGDQRLGSWWATVGRAWTGCLAWSSSTASWAARPAEVRIFRARERFDARAAASARLTRWSMSLQSAESIPCADHRGTGLGPGAGGGGGGTTGGAGGRRRRRLASSFSPSRAALRMMEGRLPRLKL